MGGLEEATRGEQFSFGERSTHEVEADRQVVGLTAGHGESW